MVAIVLLAIFVLLPRRIRSAIYKLIETFKENNATSPKNAITYDKLGIWPPPSMFSLRARLKDYKQEALTALINTEIIQMTEDGKYYLSEDKLMVSKLYRPESYSR